MPEPRLYLAGSALCFHRGWLALYRLFATRPDEGAPLHPRAHAGVTRGRS